MVFWQVEWGFWLSVATWLLLGAQVSSLSVVSLVASCFIMLPRLVDLNGQVSAVVFFHASVVFADHGKSQVTGFWLSSWCLVRGLGKLVFLVQVAWMVKKLSNGLLAHVIPLALSTRLISSPRAMLMYGVLLRLIYQNRGNDCSCSSFV